MPSPHATRRSPSNDPRRAGFMSRGLMIILPVVLAVPTAAWFFVPGLSSSASGTERVLETARRGVFVHDIVERGSVESAENTEIRCEVESHGSGGTTIISVIPEGTQVEEGDVLIVLDSSSLRDRKTQQEIVCNTSEAVFIQAENSFQTAEIDLEEYVNGTYVQKKLEIESRVFAAQEAERVAQQDLEYSEELLLNGYVTELQVQGSRYAVEKTAKDREKAEMELQVLEKYTRRKQVGQFEANIKTTRARLDSEEHSYQLDREKLAQIIEQIENCTVRAPQAGQVVYANVFDRRGGAETVIEEGAVVRERQVLIRLPDPNHMQVKALINEARIALVKPGMEVVIHLDAFPDLELTGTVKHVNEYPEPSSFWSGNVKEYKTIITIDMPDDLRPTAGGEVKLRPGLTAEVQIRVERLNDVLMVPVQAVFEHGGKNYCMAPAGQGQGWEAREVTLGSTNDKVVVIAVGLEKGEEVVMGAVKYRRELDLPELEANFQKAPPRDRRSPEERREERREDRPATGGGQPASGGPE